MIVDETTNDLEQPLLASADNEDVAEVVGPSSPRFDTPSESELCVTPPNMDVADPSSHERSVFRPSIQLIAMISNYSTSYNVMNISMVLPILEQIHNGPSSDKSRSLVATSLLAGMMLGQVTGGALGDSPYLGRLGALQCVMALQVVASLASSVCRYGSQDALALWLISLYETDSSSVLLEQQEDYILYLQLAFWRFLLGIGAGAVYPLAAVISAEQSDGTQALNANRGGEDMESMQGSQVDALSRVVLTFSMQGVGFITVPLVTFLLLTVVMNLDMVWRLILALGSLPGLILFALYYPSFVHGDSRTEVVATVAQAEAEERSPDEEPEANHTTEDGMSEPFLVLDNHSYGLVEAIRSENDLPAKLIGTAGTWFIFDVLFYGNTLFQPIVMKAAFGRAENDDILPREVLLHIALDSLLLCAIALPGYFVAAWLLGSKSRFRQTPRFVMLQGFALMCILYLCIGIFWDGLKQSPVSLILIYGLTFFFANYGPNTTTFVLPSLTYSAPCRATLNGVCAAAGKLGAFLGAALFAPVAERYGNQVVMLLCSALAATSYLMTFQYVKL